MKNLIFTWIGIFSALFGIGSAMHLLPDFHLPSAEPVAEITNQLVGEVKSAQDISTPPIETKTNELKTTPAAKVQPKKPAQTNQDTSIDDAAFEAQRAEIKAKEKELKNSLKDSDKSSPSNYVISSPAPVDNSAAIAAAAAEKQAECKKAANQCMQDIGSKIMGLQGSAYETAAVALGNDCNRQYKKCNR